jgi:tetratricopeptide (TPR) repeat protein
MKAVLKLALVASVFVLAIAFSATTGVAQEHPAYLHALTDLRHARAHLERPDHGELREQEKKAIHEIDEAINEIKKAAINDGKDLNDHPPVDARMDWTGRLHRAIELINKAHSDIAREEDNRFAQGLQQRALEHIDKAHHHVEEAIDVIRDR